MYVHVRLLTGYDNLLTYAVPVEGKKAVRVGTLVRVPLRNRVVSGLVVDTSEVAPQATYVIRDILGVERWADDQHYYAYIQDLSTYYQTNSIHFIKRMRQFLTAKQIVDTEEVFPDAHHVVTTLTDEQQHVYDFLTERITNPSYTPTLLHGITGSGKTEVYKRLIIDAIVQNRTVLLLLPEVALALQFERLLKKQLPSSLLLYSFHSATAAREKKSLWANLVAGKPMLIIGVHLPVLLPIANLGLIIVDEEHEIGYQEKKHPRVHTKEAALLRAQKVGIPILLGSATPSISSLYSVQHRRWQLFKLTKRFAGALPMVSVVNLINDKRKKNFWISRELEQAIAHRLAAREQTIIFLNRRGYSFFVQCTVCSFIFMCSSCSVSLTLHDNLRLMCHYCGYSAEQPAACPCCKASEHHFIKKGIGTQQVVTILEKMFPQALISRADLDSTSKKKEWAASLHKFEQGEIDILVGTQTITKGYHFPRVTLVGVIWGDLNLNFPVYNASETTLQQLIQVAGRAGRQSETSEVIVQTMADHALFLFLNEVDYVRFYEQELLMRQEVGYPPCMRLVEIELKSTNPEQLDYEATLLVNELKKAQQLLAPSAIILGPAKPAVHMVKNMHERIIYIKGPDIAQIIRMFASIDTNSYKSSIFFTPNPIQ
ncbi:MAG: primosomal protein N' [Epsilonproteobacteria bacterium]|nr:primosomal protein N' [Campylobacterota bacterium]